MNKKITRRVVLGAVFSALAAGPFVVRWLRSDRGAGLSEYSEIAVKEGNYGSDLSPGQVESAFDYLIKERSRWLKFRECQGELMCQPKSAKMEALKGWTIWLLVSST